MNVVKSANGVPGKLMKFCLSELIFFDKKENCRHLLKNGGGKVVL
jgi:hypothetical protein